MKARIPLVLAVTLLMAAFVPFLQPVQGSNADEDWILYEEVAGSVTVPPGGTGETLLLPDNVSISSDWPVQSPEVMAAVAAVPEWLRHDLTISFDRLDDEHRNIYAELIINAPDPRWIDEIAFVIAHSNVRTLTDQYFFPELLYDNSRLIYEADPLLEYVRIVEEQDHTTIAYIDEAGNEVMVPRDIYYWFIVHPKLGDELPTYVDPQYNYTTDPPFDRNYGTPPPTGKFWREHLLHHNRTDKPLLKDRLSSAGNIREAIRAINGWVDSSMMFTSDSERPVQPVRIYEKGIGRCGEYQDMRSAAARIALVPVVATSNSAEDHVWNEFWDGDWTHWDGTIDDPMMYERGWGKTISTVWNVRGDGYSWTVTERYSDHATLTITVLDRDGLPVDGAVVDLLTENFYNSQVKTTTASSSTSFDGNVSFTIGDGRNYWIRADGGSLGSTPVAPLPPRQIISDSVAGENYEHTISLPMAAGRLRASEKQAIGSVKDVMLRIGVEVTSHTTIGSSSVSGGPYQENGTGGDIDIFILDSDQQGQFQRGLPFDAYNISMRGSIVTIQFAFPEEGEHYLYLSNGYAQSTYKTVNVTMSLFVLRKPVEDEPDEDPNDEPDMDNENDEPDPDSDDTEPDNDDRTELDADDDTNDIEPDEELPSAAEEKIDTVDSVSIPVEPDERPLPIVLFIFILAIVLTLVGFLVIYLIIRIKNMA